ncbi:hypothetical protein B5807_00132 [Epicoccum nigrum]|uniref:Uncharacterized protein n=1 Tax=Epicoccum nigrum TaxID=105696 RepID=A0A1Y2MGC7_EPING|nr:hypothetical protein B5807_00132 [Epicoccum nigrum]
MNSMSLAVDIEAVTSFSLWASRTALSGHIQIKFSKVKTSSQTSSPRTLDTTISAKTLTVRKNDADLRDSKSGTVSPISFHGCTHARSLSPQYLPRQPKMYSLRQPEPHGQY